MHHSLLRSGAAQRPWYLDTDTTRCSTKDIDMHTQVQNRLWYLDTETTKCSIKDIDRHTQVQHRLLFGQTRPGESQVAAVKSIAESAKISAGIFKQSYRPARLH
jgi:hypothetical protein